MPAYVVRTPDGHYLDPQGFETPDLARAQKYRSADEAQTAMRLYLTPRRAAGSTVLELLPDGTLRRA